MGRPTRLQIRKASSGSLMQSRPSGPWRRLRFLSISSIDRCPCRECREDGFEQPRFPVVYQPDFDHARSKKSFQEFALFFSMPLLYMKSANASNAATS